ncbi:MAG: hypothetical protein EP346_02115 [Bacteroidetes bacterium]|nr:MAG: hypothetical protein EP346_02115 [Bacteroidota bacterium]
MSTVKITACDNQLILVATTWEKSYLVANIQSGNGNSVDVTLNLDYAKQFSGTVNLDGVNQPLSGTYSVTIPEEKVNLSMIGINWGGAADLAVNLDGKDYKYSKNPTPAMIIPLGDPYVDDNTGMQSMMVSLK